MPNLVLLAGVPGIGKSTFAKTFFDLKYAIVSSDEIRKRLAGSLRDAHRQDRRPWDVFYQDIEDRLRHNVDVIADATFLTLKHRQRALDVAARTHADAHIVLFTDVYSAVLRNDRRDEDTRVPANVMADMEALYYDTQSRLIQEGYKTITKIASFT